MFGRFYKDSEEISGFSDIGVNNSKDRINNHSKFSWVWIDPVFTPVGFLRIQGSGSFPGSGFRVFFRTFGLFSFALLTM